MSLILAFVPLPALAQTGSGAVASGLGSTQTGSGASTSQQSETPVTGPGSQVISSSFLGRSRLTLENGIGISVWNAIKRETGVMMEQTGLKISAGPTEAPSTHSFTIDFAEGRRHVKTITLRKSSDFSGHVLLTDRAGDPKKITALSGSTMTLDDELFGSLTLVIQRGSADITSMTFADGSLSDSALALSPTGDTVTLEPEHASVLRDDRLRSRDELKEEYATVSKNLDDSTNSVNALSDSISIAEKTVADMESRLSEQKAALVKANSDLQAMPAKIEVAKSQLATLQKDYANTLTSMNKAITDAEALVLLAQSGATAAEQKLGKDLNALDDANKVLVNAQNEYLFIKNGGYTGLVAQRQAELSAAQLAYDSAVAALNAEKKKKPINKAMVATLQAKVDAAFITLNNAKDALAAAKLLFSTQKTLAQAQDALLKAQNAVDALKVTVQKDRDALETANKKLSDAQAQLSAAKSVKSGKEQAIKDKQAEIDHLNEEQSALERTVISLQKSVDELSSSLNGKTNTVAALRSEIELKKSDIADLTADVSALAVLVDYAEEELKEAESLLTVAKEILAARASDLANMTQTLDELRSDIKVTSEKIDSASGSLATLSELGRTCASLRIRTKDIGDQIRSKSTFSSLSSKLTSAESELATGESSLRSRFSSWLTTQKNVLSDLETKYSIDPALLSSTQTGANVTSDMREKLAILQSIADDIKLAESIIGEDIAFRNSLKDDSFSELATKIDEELSKADAKLAEVGNGTGSGSTVVEEVTGEQIHESLVKYQELWEKVDELPTVPEQVDSEQIADDLKAALELQILASAEPEPIPVPKRLPTNMDSHIEQLESGQRLVIATPYDHSFVRTPFGILEYHHPGGDGGLELFRRNFTEMMNWKLVKPTVTITVYLDRDLTIPLYDVVLAGDRALNTVTIRSKRAIAVDPSLIPNGTPTITEPILRPMNINGTSMTLMVGSPVENTNVRFFGLDRSSADAIASAITTPRETTLGIDPANPTTDYDIVIEDGKNVYARERVHYDQPTKTLSLPDGVSFWAPPPPPPPLPVRDPEIVPLYSQNDNLASVMQEATENIAFAEQLIDDSEARDLIARAASLEESSEDHTQKLEDIGDLYREAGKIGAVPSPLVEQIRDTVLGALDLKYEETKDAATALARDGVRLEAEMLRRNATVSDANISVPADDAVAIDEHTSVRDVQGTKQIAMELLHLGGTVTVQAIKGNRSDVGLTEQTHTASGETIIDGIKSVGRATVIDFGTSESLATGVDIAIDADPAADMQAELLRGAETVQTVKLGTGRTLSFDDPSGISAIVIEHALPHTSPEALQLLDFRRNYSPRYMNNDPGPDWFFFYVDHKELEPERGRITTEADNANAPTSIVVKNVSVRGNIAAPPIAKGAMTALSNATYARLWLNNVVSLPVPRDSMYEGIASTPGLFTGIRLQKYRPGPIIEDVGYLNPRGDFVPLPRELVMQVSDTWLIAPIPSGINLALRTSGGVSSNPKGGAATGSSYDFDVVTKTGARPEDVVPERGVHVTVNMDLCDVNQSGDGWFQSLPRDFGCKQPLAQGSVKARVILSNVGTDAGALQVSVASGHPTTPGSESVVWQGSTGLSAGEGRGLWVQAPVLADENGYGLIHVTVKDSSDAIIAEGSRTIQPVGMKTAEERTQAEVAFRAQWATAMQSSQTDTVAYLRDIGANSAPAAIDWKQVVAQATEATKPEQPLPPEIAERVMRLAIIAQASARESGDPMRIAAADAQVGQSLVVYGGALAYSKHPDANKTPEQLLAFVQDEEKRDEAKQGINQAQNRAVALLNVGNMEMERIAKQTDTTRQYVASILSDIFTPLSKKAPAPVRPKIVEYTLPTSEAIKIYGENSESKVRFVVKEKSLVNAWIDDADVSLIVHDLAGLPQKYDFSLLLGGKKISPVYSANAPGSAEAISVALEPGEYVLTLQDITDYGIKKKAGIPPVPVLALANPSEVALPLHITITPLVAQRLQGRVSLSGTPISHPVFLNVAEFNNDVRNTKYGEVGGPKTLSPLYPIWIISHGMNSFEDTGPMTDLTKAVIQNADEPIQVATISWSEAAKAPMSDTTDAPWTAEVGPWAAKMLSSIGYKHQNIHLIGHSHGAYVCYEAANYLQSRFHKKIAGLIALNPAGNFPSLSRYDSSKIDFASVAKKTLAIEGSDPYDSDILSNTTQLAMHFETNDEDVGETEKHSMGPTLFADLLEKSSRNESLYFLRPKVFMHADENYFANLFKSNVYESTFEIFVNVDATKGKDRYSDYPIATITLVRYKGENSGDETVISSFQ